MAMVATDRIEGLTTSSPVVFEVRGGVEIIDALADEWRSLCDENIGHQPFWRPEWIRAHTRTHSPNAKVLLVVTRINGRLSLVLPLLEEIGTFSRIPVRKLRAPVNFNAGRFDAVRSPGPDGDAAVRATWDRLESMNGWDVLQLQYVQEGGTVAQLVATARARGKSSIKVAGNPNPYVPVPADVGLLTPMPLNARLRTKLRQVRRQLSEQGPLNFYRIDTADRVALERLYELEASGWKGREGTATNCLPWVRQFFDEVAESAARFGYLSLYMLELNGELIAAHFALTHQGYCYSPIVTFNEDYKQFSPGHLIVSEILRDCMERGIRGYDITGENQEWKLKWTNQLLPIAHYSIFKGLLGNLAHAVESKLKPAVAGFLPRKNTPDVDHPSAGADKVQQDQAQVTSR
jgi:CelD/BcsL family acetyltransferase involved in cellulose biosynthesis